MTRQNLDITTQDGTASARLFRPATPNVTRSAVLFYMDAFGLRPALDDMASRYAEAGYTVLMPDLLYRSGPYQAFDAKTAFEHEDSKALLSGMMRATTQEMTRRDGRAFLDALNNAGADGPVAVVGYCMGGARALHAAAAYPERVRAVASFHGGRLASDAADSPHHAAATITARVYVGSAGVDGSFPPEQSARLAESLRRAEVDYIIENYVGMTHGWTVPDHTAFDSAGAERHWVRALTLLRETL